jgi:tetratricopeptide (TPR) repeat protein
LIHYADATAHIGDLRYDQRKEHIPQLEAARAAAQRQNAQAAQGNALGNLGLAYAALGDACQAIDFYQQALVIAREIGDRRGEANRSWNLEDELAKQGELARAIELMQVLVDFEREIGHPNAEKHAAVVDELRQRLQAQEDEAE